MPNSLLSFSRDLLRWYHANKRDLPWRTTRDPYTIWVSEIMLQQTTVSAVIPYYEKWIRRFPTIQDLSKARQQTVLNMWQGLGYYNRAKNLHAAARKIVADYKGKLPSTKDELLNLPGFGRYTVGAVLSIAFDQKITLIDANVRRVVMRLLAIEGEAVAKHDVVIDAFLEERLPSKDMSSFNQALMELGALVCRKREPLCNICPLNRYCQAYEKGIQELIPTPKKKILKDVHVAIGVLRSGDKVYIQKRSAKGLLADLWEFPGGKIEQGESAEEALLREIQEETGAVLKAPKFLFDVKHYYTEFRVHLAVFESTVANAPILDDTHRWIVPADLRRYPMPSGSAKIVEKLFSEK